jgi:hypothetical protein
MLVYNSRLLVYHWFKGIFCRLLIQQLLCLLSLLFSLDDQPISVSLKKLFMRPCSAQTRSIVNSWAPNCSSLSWLTTLLTLISPWDTTSSSKTDISTWCQIWLYWLRILSQWGGCPSLWSHDRMSEAFGTVRPWHESALFFPLSTYIVGLPC